MAQQDTLPLPSDSLPVAVMDTLQQLQDTISVNGTDSVTTPRRHNHSVVNGYAAALNTILTQNKYLNTGGTPVVLIQVQRNARTDNLMFYILAAVIAVLAFFRFVYARYLDNVFRVFFNTSLRQSQLTDQLLQARQPSMFFNLMFTFIGGIYIYLLLRWQHWLPSGRMIFYIAVCTGALLVIYIAKYVVLKFTGWITGYREAVNTYIFIIFLINKILGILLAPFVVIMAFSDSLLKTPAAVISMLLVALMFLLRFFRSFGLLQHQLKVSRFHFFLYIAGVEVLPLLLIYKGLLVLLSKNL